MLKKIALISITFGMVLQNTAVMAQYVSVQQIYSYAQNGNLQSLQSLQHQIDITDTYGNTALCYSIMNNDYRAFSLLRQANASTQSQCVDNISYEQIKSFNDGYANWYKTVVKNSANQATKTIVQAQESTGLSTTAKVGIGVGVVALIGGGIAAAAGGGGGGSSSSESSNAVLNCKHGNWNGSKCVCQEGYTGTLCDTPKEVPSGYQAATCGSGYDTTDTFLSGTTTYYKCTPKDVPNGYQATACGSGYDTTGTFLSGTTTYYKCTPKDCSGHQTSCEAGYNATQSCLSGTTQYYTCTPKDVPNGYQATACGSGYDTADTFLSGTTTYYKCTPKDVPNGYQATACDSGYDTADTFLSGTTTYYKCTPKDVPNGYQATACGVNYDTIDTFLSGSTTYYKCACTTGYVEINGECKLQVACGTNGSEEYNGICYTIVNSVELQKDTVGLSGSAQDNILNKKTGKIIVTGETAKGISGGKIITNAGEIDVTANTGSAIGIEGIADSEITNEESGKISVSGLDGNNHVYGIKGDAHGLKIVNAGEIDVRKITENYTSSIGIGGYLDTYSGRIDTEITNEKSGKIIVQGTGAYGISAGRIITNAGEIDVTGTSEARGILGVPDSEITNEESGKIVVNGHSSYGIRNARKITNAGEINVTSTIDNALGIYGEDASAEIRNEESGKISVNALGTLESYAYGISGHKIINAGEIDVNSETFGARGISGYMDGAKITNEESGKIIVTGGSFATGIDGGTIINAGKISVGALNGHADGIFGSKILNTGEIDVTTTTDKGRGIYGSSEITNDISGKIVVKSTDGTAIGMESGTTGITITNAGTITITGAETGYGIYHRGNGGSVTNTGTIDVTATNAYGIYVADGTNTTVTNTGTIKLNGVECTGDCSGNATNGNYIVLNGATLVNAGTMTAQTMNLDDMGGDVVATTGSTFNIQDKLSGTLNVSADTVQNGFDTTYQLSDVIQAGNTDELKLASQSAMFDAQLSENKNDIMMTMKSFDKMTDNKSLASFLDKNYAQGNNENFFNTLKSFKTGSAFSSSLNSLTGKETLSQFNYEDLSAMREVSLAMNELMFNNQEQPMFETMGTINSFGFRNDSSSTSQYAIGRKRINSKFNIGYGMSHTNVSSDDDNDTTRRNQIFQAFVPMGYAYKGWQMISTPQMGYARGHYNRKGFNDTTYEGYIEKRIVALTNEARYPMQFGNVELAPTVELNAIAYNQKGKEDDKAYALTIPSENNLSVEAGLGLHAKSQIGNLKLNGGLMVYQEFADPYNIKMGMQGMEGTFDLYDNRSKYRGVGTFGFDYSVGDLNMYGNLQHFIEDDNHTKFKTGLKFKF